MTYYMHDGFAEFRFQLAGDLSHDSTADLEQARQTASSVFGGRSLIVDLTGLEKIDTAGRELLERWRRLGAQLVVTTPEAKTRIRAMAGVPFSLLEKRTEGDEWLTGRAVVWLLAVTSVLLALGQAR